MRHPIYDPMFVGVHRCCKCRLLLPATAFSPSARVRRSMKCMECCRLAMRVNYNANKAKSDAIKLERGCTDCGYREHACALEFDHLPGFTKIHQVSDMYGNWPWAKVEAEIAKCEVVCSNCHRVRTHQRTATVKYWKRRRSERGCDVVTPEEDELPLSW